MTEHDALFVEFMVNGWMYPGTEITSTNMAARAKPRVVKANLGVGRLTLA
jgi:hypothetical protein